MATITVNKSHTTINIPSNASYIVNGDDDTVLLGSDDVVSVKGSALYVQVDGPGDVLTIGGNGAAASNVNNNIVWFQNVAGTLHEIANARTDVTANLVVATMAGHDALGLYGVGDTVAANGTDDAVWIGQNGYGVTGAALDSVRGLTHGSVNELQGSSVSTVGSYYTVTLAAQDLLLASGVGVSVTVTAAGDAVYIGGNGAKASNADEDVVLFQAAGTINLTANSRVDTTGSNVSATLTGSDTFGLYGAGETVTANGTGDAVWIGQNGYGVTGAALDVVRGLTHGSVNEMQGSSVSTSGSYYAVTMAAQDLLLASGVGVNVTVTAAGDAVYIGGNGAGASSADEDVVLFQAAGTIHLTANSRVDTSGSNVSATLTGSDTFGLYGAGDAVTANGTGDAIWIGQNGYTAAAAAIDKVHGLTRGVVNEMQGSSVSVDGTNYNVTMGGDDRLSVSGAGATVNIAGGQANTLIADHATVNSTYTTAFDLFGDNNTVNVQGGAAVQILGGGNHVTINQGTTLLVSQNHDPNIAVNTVDWTGAPAQSIAPITIEGYTLASLTGSYATIQLVGGGDVVTVDGSGDSVSGTLDNAGDAITIGGNGSTYQSAGQDKVTMNLYDHVTLLANSNVAVTTTSGATSGLDSVQMAGDDSLSIGTNVTVDVPISAGADYLAGFGSTDVLVLAAHFASVSDLLAHTGYNHLNQTTIQLDTNGDTLSLDISKSAVATYANAGFIRFS